MNARSKYTPGPWTAKDYRVFKLSDDDTRIVAYARGLNSRERTREDLANSRLIAAAPKLLAVCIELVEEHAERIGTCSTPCQHLGCKFIAEARAAIAEATGEPHE